MAAADEQQRRASTIDQPDIEDAGAGAGVASTSSTAPLQIDLVMAVLEAKKTPDHLNLADDDKVALMLHKYGDDERPRDICFSDMVTKFNRKRKAQSRVLLITKRAVYNLEPSKYKAPKRRIDIRKLMTVTLSDSGDDFVLHVRDEHDYHFRSFRRAEIVHELGVAFRDLVGQELRAELSSLEDISSKIKTKELMHIEQHHAPSALQQLQQQRKSTVPTTTRDGSAGAAGTAARGGADDGIASAMSPLKFVRGLVSKKKKRFQEHGFDLDLTYVTDRIIAMGYPSEALEGMYRNPYPEVYRFLEQFHAGHYRVYNLCSERKYASAKFYSVACFPFDDHNAPPLRLILEFCQDVTEFLQADDRNVIAVHCKAGKGRTGTLIAAYLLWCEEFCSAEDALAYFGKQRTSNGKGVTIPSQRRFVAYFEQFLRNYYAPKRPFLFGGHSLVLTNVRVLTIPHFSRDGGCDLYFKVFHVDGTKLYDSRSVQKVQHSSPDQDRFISVRSSARVSGEFKMVFMNEQKSFGSDDKVCHLWADTNFIEDNCAVFTKYEIDKAHKDRKNKHFDEHFRIELFFRSDDVIMEESQDEADFLAMPSSPRPWDVADVAGHINMLETQGQAREAERQKLRAVREREETSVHD